MKNPRKNPGFFCSFRFHLVHKMFSCKNVRNVKTKTFQRVTLYRCFDCFFGFFERPFSDFFYTAKFSPGFLLKELESKLLSPKIYDLDIYIIIIIYNIMLYWISIFLKYNKMRLFFHTLFILVTHRILPYIIMILDILYSGTIIV